MMVRKSALVLILLVGAIMTAIVLLISNSLVESKMEELLTSQFNAQSDVNGVDLSPFKLQGEIGRIEIADQKKPMQNLVASGKAEMDIAGWSLLRGNVVVNKLQVNNLELDGKRKTSGALPSKTDLGPRAPANSNSDDGTQSAETPASNDEEDKTDWKAMVDDLPQIDFSQVAKQLDIPDLTKDMTFQSVERIKEAKVETRQSIDTLTGDLKNGDVEKRIAETRAQISQLQNRKITDLKSAEKALNEIKAIDKNIKQINSDYKNIRKKSDDLISQTKLQKGLVSTELKKDMDTVKQLAKISDIDTKDIAAILFGQTAMKNMQQIMGYIDLIKEYMPESGPEEEITRRSGRDIAFPVTTPFEPRLLIKTIGFAGNQRSRIFSGNLLNFSSNPVRYQKPVILTMKSQVDESLWLVNAEMKPKDNHLTHTLGLRADNIKKQSFRLSDKSQASSPQKADLTNSDIDIKLALDKTSINGHINLTADKLKFVFTQTARTNVDRQIQNAFNSFSNVTMNTTISGTIRKPIIKLKTNFDQKIANNLKQVVGKQISKANRDLENYVNNKVAQELNISNKELEKYTKPARDILAGNKKGIDELTRLRTATENQLNQKLTAQKNKATRELKKKAEDKLKKSIKSLKF